MKSPVGSSARVLCVGLFVLLLSEARGQSVPTSATIDAIPLDLIMPEQFQVVSTLEPIRRVLIVAPADGLIRTVDAGLGATVRQSQEIVQFDRAEAAALLKIARAELKEKQTIQAPTAVEPLLKAQIEAAEARVELAQISLDRLTLRAPFPGRIIEAPVAAGQFVLKGTVIAELADVSSLKAQVPVDRRNAKIGGELVIQVEEEDQTARVQSIGPLLSTDDYQPLRELAAPFAAAWVQVANPKGELEPGLRVRSSSVPVTAIATVPVGAVKPIKAGAEASQVQVIRHEYVTNVPVHVLGKVGPDRLQVSGAFRERDGLIASSSTPLLAGTLVRFGEAAPAIEAATPDPARRGQNASVAAPGNTAPSTAPRPRANPPARRPTTDATPATPF